MPAIKATGNKIKNSTLAERKAIYKLLTKAFDPLLPTMNEKDSKRAYRLINLAALAAGETYINTGAFK